ncbi:hypothetical protein A3A36_01315 [Candidatus Kaiserbacteria bacterium RIFCSPLOWO2_01_FULL_52_12b]|uniref:Uncharacterized protein n=1 Tax=Candidatus Kaiserbacteria bacterium RIFCSPLOWO2_01_FULL_52_12b TaxID=1798509 RepID=A0A1F6EW68_9BACT|nr:MAG: hypothetical protein A3A36_01315 [Candidatus Kaiserbacteria bacterium RIFCSPLOWO2_01_FULL_52_12b]
MSKQIRLIYASPGTFLYFPLPMVIHPKGNRGLDEWGVCECTNLFWLGGEAFVGGQNVLGVSSLDISEKRDETYADWGEEEIYVSVGIDGNGNLTWFLLNQEEYEKRKEMLH